MWLTVAPLLVGWILDLLLGDPLWLPHPVVLIGKTIALLERRFNRGTHRRLAGAFVAVCLVCATFFLTWWLLRLLSFSIWLKMAVEALLVFYCLAGTTLVREVKGVFLAAEKSLEAGRRQVSRIVGRDTMSLTAHEVKIAALETGAENLSDGVVAPLFWYALLGVPGMLAYKVINTLDSMIGYRNERYREFGTVAARMDDAANFLPARITAFLMVLSAGRLRLWGFVRRYGRKHLSPNSGWPEAALAGILGCRFGGPHNYFGELVEKPYIGETEREVSTADAVISLRVNRMAETLSVLLAAAVRLAIVSL